ncbi:hypothetical protein PRZ48_013712 [Zasmidium cellare]|uniref:Piwi domain-containing protein n=1 Tax=Zasmidium cellare TaxID=395010 RepID=A0ABR0E2D4_ZASCE|nr:hypothetical protein PRZ48_013712 [Zasmidium cellare]
MSSGKAPVDQQKASNSNNLPPHRRPQQPATASMSYSNAAAGLTPATPKPKNLNTTTPAVSPSANTGSVTAQMATLQLQGSALGPQAMNVNVASQTSNCSHSNTKHPAPPPNDSNQNQKPTNGGDDNTKKQSKTSEDTVPKLTFFDETYALDSGTGSKGDKTMVLVNRFSVRDRDIGNSLHVYTVRFPQIRGRDVKNSAVKKLMLREILSSTVFQQLYSQNKVFTDWSSTIITKEKLDPNLFNQRGILPVNYTFLNESSPAAGPQPYTADIVLTRVLDMVAFKDYVHGRNNKPANFDFGEHTRALNILARHFAARNVNIASAGRNRIFPQNPQFPLPSGLHARQGFFNSIRPADGGIQLQLNTTAAAFYPGMRLIDYLSQRFRGEFSLTQTELAPDVKAVMENLQVLYMYTPPNALPTSQSRSPLLANPVTQGGRSKRISGYGLSARTQTFPLNGQEVTVEQHFNKNVMMPQHPLRYPHLPAVNTGPAIKRNNGTNNTNKPVWVPMELLFIKPDQALSSTVPGNDMTNMGNASRRQPQLNVDMIRGHGPAQGLGLLQARDLDRFNVLHLDFNLLQIAARKLQAPQLQYSRSNTITSDQGKWNLKGVKFQTGGRLGKLFVIQITDRKTDTPATDGLVRALSQYGVVCTGSLCEDAANCGQAELDRAYAALQRKSGGSASVILVILPSDNIDNYSIVKWWGDCKRGVNTVCVTRGKLGQLTNPGFTANLALKFNAKLGGQNHILTKASYTPLHVTDSATTMVVGADVTHPGPSSVKYCPSIAGVVASTDRHCVKFPGSMRLQASRTEQILELKDMMVERLRLWFATNDKLPDRILFYRDGVGEDQFAMVKRHELPAVRAACELIAIEKKVPDYNPPITMVVCTKRHANRFYPISTSGTNAKFVDGKTKNFKPGLVVDDRSIRLPKLFDFWLQAHQPLQGTGRPCHYFVLENGIGYTPDDLQQVTFALSWVYATSLTPISVVAPAYYADKLCERGRCYLRPLLIGRHPFRPSPANYSAWLARMGDLTDEEFRHEVARRVATTPLPSVQNRYWNQVGTVSPCHASVKDTMFYV